MKVWQSMMLGSLMVGLGLGACTRDEQQLEDPVQSAASQDQTNDQHKFTVDDKGNVNFELEIVYFKFDDYTLTSQGRERLNRLASYLKKHPQKKLSISGHCDERGSPEYNLALGQQRAQSVKSHLRTLGITDDRLATVSFGEEKPAVKGQGEHAWSKNRRAEFKFIDG